MKAFSKKSAARGGLLAGVAGAALGVAGPALAADAAPNVNLTKVPLNSSFNQLVQSEVVSPNGKTLYISSGGALGSGEGVYAINLAHPSATPTQITDGGSPLSDGGGLAISPNGRKLYIGYDNIGGSGSPTVAYIADVGGSGATNNTVVGQVTDTAAPSQSATGMAVSPNGRTLYVGEEVETGSTQTFEIDSATLSSTSGSVVSSYGATDLGFVTGLALSPNGKLLYASNFVGPATVEKVSGTSVSSPRLLPQVYGSYDLAVSPDGRTLYSTVFNLLAIQEQAVTFTKAEIDTFGLSANGTAANLSNSTVLKSLMVPLGIALSSNGTAGYVAQLTYSSSGSGPGASGVDRFAIKAAASAVTIAGTAKLGHAVTAAVKSASGASLSYAWYANGKAIGGATKSKLVIGGSLAGKKLTVKVTAAAVGYHSATVTSKAVTVK